ncbi:MAG: hypothetical protein JWN76_2389 [Chitinophagaceae bacterium]|nr:hypothetical protein [Chitinophagaceae bacterium]
MKNSIKGAARTAGLLYLVNIVFGFFAIGYVPGVIIVSGDAAATAHNMLAHEQLYRMGLVAHIIILLTNIPLAVIFYQVFKVVSWRVSLLVVFFTLTGTTIETVNLLNQFAPLVLLKSSTNTAFTAEQLQGLSYMLHQLQTTGVNLAFLFFGCYGISMGYLIFRSGFFPRTIGVMMAIGGVCYAVNSFANFLAPAFAANLFPYIQLPSGLAELCFCLWLLIVGLNVKKWQEKSKPQHSGIIPSP